MLAAQIYKFSKETLKCYICDIVSWNFGYIIYEFRFKIRSSFGNVESLKFRRVGP